MTTSEERLSRLEGAYEHLATKADVESVKVDVESVKVAVGGVEGGNRPPRGPAYQMDGRNCGNGYRHSNGCCHGSREALLGLNPHAGP